MEEFLNVNLLKIMDKLWYRIIGGLVLLIGLIWILGNINFNIIGQDNFREIFIGGILGSVLIFVLFFFPGMAYLKMKKYNKLTNSSLVLIIIGIIWIVLLAIYEFIINPTDIAIRGLGTFLFGIIPAGILYGISILLLIINLFKNK